MDLQQQDQIVLLRASSFEIMVLRASRAYNPENQTILFDGKFTPLATFKSLGLPEFSDSMYKLIHEIQSIKLTENQLSILGAIILFSRDRPGLIEPIRIDNIQEKLIHV